MWVVVQTDLGVYGEPDIVVDVHGPFDSISRAQDFADRKNEESTDYFELKYLIPPENV